MYIKPIDGNHLVEKRNVLNEMVWKEKITLQALKFLSLYLARINASDPENTRKVRFTAKEFARIMEFKGNFNKDHYIKTVDRLMNHVIHIHYPSGEIDSFPLFNYSKLRQCKNSGEWYVEMDANDLALPLMFDFKDRYFTYELWNVLQLKSFNHLRMYEILKQYETAGIRRIKLDDLKIFLGIEPDEYPRWTNFQTRILRGCQKALAEKTDIVFDYKPIRNGRGGKVIGVEFRIMRNTAAIQLTLDEFIGGTDNFQLTFDDLEHERFSTDLAADEPQISKPSQGRKRKNNDKNYTPEDKKTLKEYAEVCQNTFTDKEIKEIFELIHGRIQEPKRVNAGHRKAYLQEAYVSLLIRERNDENDEKIGNRFKYLLGVLKNKLREKALEKNNPLS
jgi:plasmid replication initiation protein